MREINFDGLVGPTHNFAGLSHGNIASSKSAESVSNPREAALQGLQKMQALSNMGLLQAVLPPHERPHIPTLKALGFTGSDQDILASVQKHAPHLLASTSSASSMWVANAATVSPAPDTKDGKTHFTPANLAAMFHRSIEHETTSRILKAIFESKEFFTHHPALPSVAHFGDEGAANHTRLTGPDGGPGIELFVYGVVAFDKNAPRPQKFPARQTREASEAVARLHGLEEARTLFAAQNPAVIDAGVFHNDVIAVGNDNCLFYHQDAFIDAPALRVEISNMLPKADMHFVEVPRSKVSVDDAISSYLFNTQLITDPANDGSMLLIAPMECRENNRVHSYLEDLLCQNTPIKKITYMDVRESMKNGGGPACLRLRVSLSDAARASINARVFLDNELFRDLNGWAEKHYRDRLSPNDLADPKLLIESRTALDDLTQIMQLGSIYDFQLL
ncbi:MAG: N-succinylarginine dihydrolase [Sneathiella sp.]